MQTNQVVVLSLIQRKLANVEEGFLQSLSQLTLAELAKDISVTLPE